MQSADAVLVVDDNDAIRTLLELALADAGHEVVGARDGASALALAEAEAARFRALVTDVELEPGGVTGWDVGRRGRELNPNLPVIYITGGEAGRWPSRGVPRSLLLTKPFAPEALVAALAQLLTAPLLPDGTPAAVPHPLR